ncbi:MAG TPA: DUF427 domain-containing protein [Acidimicrobiales bacterium]|jgi:uncharacterized protein (DUF427 family)
MKPQPIVPGPGQESVWTYPRPPRVEAVRSQVEVNFAGETIALTLEPLRVLETSHPPGYYFPPSSVVPGLLHPTEHRTWCEFKGEARYFTVALKGEVAPNAAWCYAEPLAGYEALAGYFSFYPSRMDACYVDGEFAQGQAGGFYGGWITSTVVGPFKGEPGSAGW